MSRRGGGRGEYYKNKYGGGGRGRGGEGRGRGGHAGGFHSGQDDRSIFQMNSTPIDKMPTRTIDDLADMLYRIDGKSYPAYRDVERTRFEAPLRAKKDYKLTVVIDHVQSDPFASPSRIHVEVACLSGHNFPEAMYAASKVRNIALCDYLTRSFSKVASAFGADMKSGGEGWHGAKGGDIRIDKPGQHVIERSSVKVHFDSGVVEARFSCGLPARGRSICGDWAIEILCRTLPRLVEKALLLESLSEEDIWKHLLCIEDQAALREMIGDRGLVGFVSNGAILPRRSGESDEPMSANDARPFVSPKDLEVEFTVPNRGRVVGMGIKAGVTLFVGGGFHGKTTILKALEVGVYNHVPGDGREFVVVNAASVKIRAEDSRSVVKCDISPFINNLPFGKDTTCFTTLDASGSTSQAANIIEALEVGASVLLIDEDTCATNFMIRDRKMQKLVAKDKEPITPFISKVRTLYEQCGVSSILVVGGAGDYFAVADTVVMMDAYEPKNVTREAKEIVRQDPTPLVGLEEPFGNLTNRVPIASGFEAQGKVATRQIDKVQYGHEDLDLTAVEQLVEVSQTRTIADLISFASARVMDGNRTLMEVVSMIDQEIDKHSLDVISPGRAMGNYCRPRRFEIAAAMNRLRSATMRQSILRR